MKGCWIRTSYNRRVSSLPLTDNSNSSARQISMVMLYEREALSPHARGDIELNDNSNKSAHQLEREITRQVRRLRAAYSRKSPVGIEPTS
jgi:hypothetical protein